MVVGLGSLISMLDVMRSGAMHLAASSDANESEYSPANMRELCSIDKFHINAVAQPGALHTGVLARIQIKLMARLGAMERSPGLIAL